MSPTSSRRNAQHNLSTSLLASSSQTSMLWNIQYLESLMKFINDSRNSQTIKLQSRINHFNSKMFAKIENMKMERNRILYENETKMKN
ncbi:Uncharacterized protein BM_BM17478 [Brugia malayi]|uniref:Uncharacterized protein n=1 Tax=Brugia malayi TaxID=6279 RepID=A0A4E9FAL5_BRUMA|nr:Uncharacterized protein BM_BM17478 [Brugia malayi]VIO93228.1 Uncharacterized protein BM_BM17478 [Brugia malayi]